MMNFGISGGTITPGTQWHQVNGDCRYEMLMKSLPNFVFYGFGAFDSKLTTFNVDTFKKAYDQLINDTQNLPSKPMVFLMVPMFTCANAFPPDLDGVEGYLVNHLNCTKEASSDMY